ncbi:MAG: valine--tRNA ligase [Alphaproteobacteria bacterium]|nr:valine--tRNA ligase [Alphaproteobacteria bacterium]
MTTETPQQPNKKLDFTAIEQKWPQYWRDRGVYTWNPETPREDSFVIDTPPPTVSGFLHIGHVYSFTQTDFIARFQRMSGKNVYYPIGYDDNGLPTERMVEKNRDIKAADMSREEFIAICMEEVEKAKLLYRNVFQRMALSVDWATEYNTISDHSRKISQMSVLDLYNKGHLYRSMQPTLWDPTDRTALAQADIEEKEQSGVMYQIPFKAENGQELVIATTRPELLPACVALMCHPDDERIKPLIGQKIYTALFEIEVPLIADERVNPEKGTGLVMCCTFGDLTDVEWWKQYQLPLRDIVGKDGLLHNLGDIGKDDWISRDPAKAQEIAAQLSGQHVRKARKAMVDILREYNYILAEDTITQSIPCAERSGTPLEIIVTPQWTVRLLDKKDLLLEKAAEITWRPDYMRQRLDDWIINLKWDWGISRQRFFGVPIPFWYSNRPGEEGKVIIPLMDELPVNPLATPPRGYTMEEVTPEKDVLDTWATSSMSPQMQSGGVSKEMVLDPARHAKLFPADLRPQAHEIIRTWAFYTIVKAALHENSVPFKNTAISGWCLAQDKSKMSKSKGNVLRPEDVMEQHNVDAIRYWAANGRLGRDSAYSEEMLKTGKRHLTKMWNAARLVQIAIAGYVPQTQTAKEAVETGLIKEGFDLWILARLQQVVTECTNAFNEYEYTDALASVEKFFWADFCDNYLELAKGRLYREIGDEAGYESARATLYFVQEAMLQLFAPFFPYMTEELYEELFPTKFAEIKSIHARGNWPKAENFPLDQQQLQNGAAAIDVLSAVRKMKSALNQSMRLPIVKLTLSAAPEKSSTWQEIEQFWPDLQKTISCDQLDWQDQALANDNSYDGETGLYRIQAILGEKQ